jgi:hypothetical protein
LSNLGEISASGNITFHWTDEDVIGTATVKASGARQLRLEAAVPNGHPIWIAHAGGGKFVDLGGTSHTMPVRDAWSFASLLSPFSYLLEAAADNRLGIKYDGLVDHAGKQLLEIEIQGFSTSAGAGLVLDFRRCVFVDPSTNVVLSVADETWPQGVGTKKILHEIIYSNYQTVQGVTLPSSISDYVAGQNTFDLQLTQISATSTVTDSDFSVD